MAMSTVSLGEYKQEARGLSSEKYNTYDRFPFQDNTQISIAPDVERFGVCPAIRLKSSLVGRTNKAIIIDIDECMAHSFSDKWDILGTIMSNPEHMAIRKRLYVIKVNGLDMWGIKRPYLYEFLKFCHEYFDEVNVWTAGLREYADQIVPLIFEDLPPPRNVYARENCQIIAGERAKRLDHIVSDKVKLHNTFTLDNDPRYMRFNIHNGIVIMDFEPASVSDVYGCDTGFPMIMRWLNQPHVRQSTDVRMLDKSSIFLP